MKTNVTWLRVVLVWTGVVVMAVVVFLLVRLQMFVHQPNVQISTRLKFDNVSTAKALDQLPTQDNASLLSLNASENSNRDRSNLLETKEPFWQVIDSREKDPPLDQWLTVLVQNKAKIDLSLTPESTQDWEWVKKGNKIRVQFRSELDARKDILARKKQGKYSVQLLSLGENKFSLAVTFMRRLILDGHYAYLHRTEQQYEEKYWYRLRVGFFKNAQDAMSVGKEIYEKYRQEKWISDRYWPVIPSSRELSRELIDLKQPMNKPWIIQIPLFDQMQPALESLASFSLDTDFSYISRIIPTKTMLPVYRIRVGFHETQEEALTQKKILAKKHPVFKSAKVYSLQ